ncbi:TrlF family AAA-like ATPase [Baileyella intestinalis]|uniref:TrlF family AAA-like ATPase n=1 Tax=Baileyella intestinalis TaxID=2606709 RepID=UPI0022E6BA43|nr:hypothetical protein [Baileyella intestinalis]
MQHFERGSEWRRWDLHIHTPGTIKNDQYEGSSSEEKWNNFYDAISLYIGDASDPLKAIEVIGITDYLSIDNYLKIVADKRLPKSINLVLPNVELRMIPFAKNSPVNIHCIFDPEIVDELQGRFFSKLTFPYRGSSYNASHDELVRLGRDFKGDQSLPQDVAYEIGISQFVLEFSTLKSIFDNDSELRDHCIIVISNSSSDGASGIVEHSAYFMGNESQMDATRSAMYQFADMIFSGKDSDIKYFIGASADDENTVKKKCGSLKPCIHGSDAHSCKGLFEPKEKRYCWIKADPTFNGFRQVLFEPKDRVRISQIMPETKPDYQVIDKVEICDDDFAPTPIYFNDKLTCIIGGKSTGKSLLLHNMALTIDPEQVEDKATVTGSRNKVIQDIKVYWRDGAVSQKGLNSQEHKIVYIPQTYLNRLSDEHEELTEIDKIIHDIVMLNVEAKKSYDDMNQRLASLKAEIDRAIYTLIQQYIDWQNRVETLAEIGTRSGIEKEIKKLEGEKEKLSKELSLSEDEISTYDEATKTIATLNGEISCVEKYIAIIQEIQSLVALLDIDYDLPDDLSEAIKKAGEKAIEAADNTWRTEQLALLKGLMDKLNALQEERGQKVAIAEPLAVKISENEAIKKISDSLQAEEEKLLRFNETEGQANKSKEKYDGLLKTLARSFIKYRDLHQVYADSINDNTSLAAEDLEFSVETPFRREAFIQVIRSSFDRRTSFKAVIDLDNCTEEWVTEDNVLRLIDAVVSGTIHLTKNKNPENVLRELLGDWYNSAYRVSMDGDLIDEMSPGKKALVLLKMLISLAESTCPILVDQPEDDLDNRSIFGELIPFIKKKKIMRQVIVVTHNANVVLGADADEIIVANQDGKNSPNKQFRFEYRTGSIEDDMPEESGRTDTLGKQGIQQQICDILEGGQSAFDLRKHKYRM